MSLTYEYKICKPNEVHLHCEYFVFVTCADHAESLFWTLDIVSDPYGFMLRELGEDNIVCFQNTDVQEDLDLSGRH